MKKWMIICTAAIVGLLGFVFLGSKEADLYCYGTDREYRSDLDTLLPEYPVIMAETDTVLTKEEVRAACDSAVSAWVDDSWSAEVTDLVDKWETVYTLCKDDKPTERQIVVELTTDGILRHILFLGDDKPQGVKINLSPAQAVKSVTAARILEDGQFVWQRGVVLLPDGTQGVLFSVSANDFETPMKYLALEK